MNLAQILSDRAAAEPERRAVLFEDETISYGELDRRAAAAAKALRADGVRAGERVAIQLPNTPAYLAAYLGALRLGATTVPLNVLLSRPEIETRLVSVTPAAHVDRPLPVDGRRDPGGPLAREDVDAAAVLFTSGTTGRPKGAVLTHGGIRAAAGYAVSALGLGGDDVILGVAPFPHVLGQQMVVSALLTGATLAVMERFDPHRALSWMAETGTTILVGVPTMCVALCQAARETDMRPPLRIAHVGGAAMPVGVIADVERTFGAPVHEGYGLTEMSGLATTFGVGSRRKPGGVGRPSEDTEVRVAQPDAGGVGEVQFRGPSVVARFWDDPAATAAAIDPDGWLSTGDLGRLDDDGDLFLVDRIKEMIIRGGYNVYPREVEDALYGHPDVLEVAVIGIPDERLGEEVAAFVVPRAGALLDPEGLKAWAKERVAAYKYPRRVAIVDALPKSPTGKILKRDIDARAAGGSR